MALAVDPSQGDINGIALVRTTAGPILVAWDGDRAEVTLFDHDGRAVRDQWIDASSPAEVANGLRGLAGLPEQEAQIAAGHAIRLAGEASVASPNPSGRTNLRTIGYGIVLILLIGAAVLGIYTALTWIV
jgi:hypothetical protein